MVELAGTGLMTPVTTCNPATVPGANGLGSIWTAWLVQGLLSAGRICTGRLPWLVNESDCGGLVSPGASAPKSSSAVDGIKALSPLPAIGTANVVSLSAPVTLLTFTV